MEYTYQRLLVRRHCVIVVAEGAGSAMRGGINNLKIYLIIKFLAELTS